VVVVPGGCGSISKNAVGAGIKGGVTPTRVAIACRLELNLDLGFAETVNISVITRLHDVTPIPIVIKRQDERTKEICRTDVGIDNLFDNHAIISKNKRTNNAVLYEMY